MIQHPAPLSDENELPNLLVHRSKRQCKTSHGNRKLAPESKSTGTFHGAMQTPHGALVHSHTVSQLSLNSLESSKSLGARDSKFNPSISDESSDCIDSERCHKAFPLKAAPLKRWRAAAKIQSYLAKWRKHKGRSMSDPNPQVGVFRVAVSEPSKQTWIQHWPEEPDAPTKEDLDELTELESLLTKHHGTIAASCTFVMNCIKNIPGSSAEYIMTKRDLTIALKLMARKEATEQVLHQKQENSFPDCDRLEQMFDRLLKLFRRRDCDISKNEFVRFPELLSREKVLQERVADYNGDVLIGSRLLNRFNSIRSSEDALEVFQKTVVALELEPCRTTNILYQISSASGGASGLTSVISNITRIAQQFGGPNQGVRLNVLLASWTLCAALAKQVIALGVPTPLGAPVCTPDSSKNKSKLKSPTFKLRIGNRDFHKQLPSKFGKKYKVKVDPSPEASREDQIQKHEGECKMAFWQALPTGEILWNLSCGAEVLNNEEFKTLVSTAWGLFDAFDAVACLLGPVGLGRMRPKLDALLTVNLEPHVLGKDPEHARSQLQNAGVVLQQIASMCQADPRLARIAGLFGASLLADRICSTANASVNFADGAVGSAAAQVNRSAAAVTEELWEHVDELLGGRKVECCLSSGQYKIVHATPAAANPLAEWHQNITAQVLAKATVKGDGAGPSLRPSSEDPHCLSKALAGYSNLQDF